MSNNQASKTYSQLLEQWKKDDQAIVSKKVDTTLYLEQRLSDSEMRRCIMAKTLTALLTKLALEEQATDDGK